MPDAPNDPFPAFLQRIWQHDVAPLLRGRRAAQRAATTARVGGKIAAAGGLLVDSLRLKGRPFTRFMTVMGASLGAMLPDAWDWRWLQAASSEERDAATAEFARRAAELPQLEALELFALPPSATLEDLRDAWRTAAHRWHPDKAPTDAARHEHRLRFVAYQAAYERLTAAYESGELPL